MRDGKGSSVTWYTSLEVMIRQVPAAGGYLAQSSRVLHFGLGDRGQIDRAVIRWPGGRVQTIAGPGLNKLHRVTEPKE